MVQVPQIHHRFTHIEIKLILIISSFNFLQEGVSKLNNFLSSFNAFDQWISILITFNQFVYLGVVTMPDTFIDVHIKFDINVWRKWIQIDLFFIVSLDYKSIGPEKF